MNANTLEEIRAAAASNGSAVSEPVTAPALNGSSPATAPSETSSDAKMEQIRQLLLGDQLSENAERLLVLEARQDQFEKAVLHRLDVISQRLDALSRDVLSDRRSAFDELARSMQELSQRIRGI